LKESNRLRECYIIKDHQNQPESIYDIERSFIFKIPHKLKEFLPDNFIKNYDGNNNLPNLIKNNNTVTKWLMENDIITKIEENKNIKSSSVNSLPLITDISLDIAGACNLSCVYCFEKDINSRLGPMSESTAFDSIDFFFKKSGNEKHVAVHFGSGEPLSNFKLLKKITVYAEKLAKDMDKTVAFHITTNGTLITKTVAEFLNEHNFYVRMSIDSIYHNQTRPTLLGNSTYESVEKGFLLLRDLLGPRLTVNVVFCRGMRLKEIYEWALKLSIKNLEVIKVGTFRDDNIDLNDEHLLNFRNDLYYIINDLYYRANNDENILHYHPITKTLRRLSVPAPAERFCGVASTYLGVSSKGDVYPCFRHLGLDTYHLGNVKNGVDDDKRKSYLSNEAQSVETRPICSTCWARKLCGGGCYADSVVYGPDKNKPQTQHCPFWKEEIRNGILLYNRIINEKPDLLFKLTGKDIPLDD